MKDRPNNPENNKDDDSSSSSSFDGKRAYANPIIGQEIEDEGVDQKEFMKTHKLNSQSY